MTVISSGVVAGLAAAALVCVVPLAHATTGTSGQTDTIRPGDFISALSDTRSSGHVDFLKDGLHVWTDDATSNAKAAEYFPVRSQGLPSSASLTWWGTSPQPGEQLVFDADGSSATTADSWNVLVGEPVYNGDYWMSTGSWFYHNEHNLCPETTGGSGSDCHGTLAQWQAVLPDAKLWAAGFSLGSGIQGNGVIHDIQVGSTDYRFTDEPAVTTVPVTGSTTLQELPWRNATVLKLTFTTNPLGANQVEGKKLVFKVMDGNDVDYRTTLGAGDAAYVRLRFPVGSGRHVVRVFQDGQLVRQRVVDMSS